MLWLTRTISESNENRFSCFQSVFWAHSTQSIEIAVELWIQKPNISHWPLRVKSFYIEIKLVQTIMKLFKNFEKLLSFAVARAEIAKPNWSVPFEPNLPKSVRTKPFSLKNFMPYIPFGYGVILTLIFLLFKATEFVEYSESFYPFATSLLNLCNVTVLILNGSKFFELINHIERTVEKRKLNLWYYVGQYSEPFARRISQICIDEF